LISSFAFTLSLSPSSNSFQLISFNIFASSGIQQKSLTFPFCSLFAAWTFSLTEMEDDYLIIFKYASVTPPPSIIDKERTLRRFASHETLTTWEKDGAVIIPNIFSYLNTIDIMAAIDTEFDMYQISPTSHPQWIQMKLNIRTYHDITLC
jgi:hypothetical protein